MCAYGQYSSPTDGRVFFAPTPLDLLLRRRNVLYTYSSNEGILAGVVSSRFSFESAAV
jgi:hypothetical protein